MPLPIEPTTGEIVLRAASQGVANYDTNAASDETALHCMDESRAQQHMKDEVDINTIVKNFGLTGQLPTDVRVPLGDEFQDITDFHTAVTKITQAREGFMKLPADIRTRFNNDPGNLINFLEDPNNRDEAVRMGIVNAPPAPPAPAPSPSGPEPT